MYHNGLWFSRTRDQSFNFLRTYKTPLQNNLKIQKPVKTSIKFYNFLLNKSRWFNQNKDSYPKFNFRLRRTNRWTHLQRDRQRSRESFCLSQCEKEEKERHRWTKTGILGEIHRSALESTIGASELCKRAARHR